MASPPVFFITEVSYTSSTCKSGAKIFIVYHSSTGPKAADTMGGFDLARAIIIPQARFRAHNNPRNFQARLRFCSNNASAASSPLPPQ